MAEEEVADEQDVIQGTVDDVQKGCFGVLLLFFSFFGTIFLLVFLTISF